MVKFDPTKPVQTRSGLKARIVGGKVKGPYGKTIAAIIEHPEGWEQVEYYFENGRVFEGEVKDPFDLVSVPKKHVRWFNFYKSGWSEILGSREEADDRARVRGAFSFEDGRRVACVRIEFEEGEGLE